MTPIDATALAIFFYEGANKVDPTTRNMRNLNPGNLRPYKAGQAVDEGGYRTFSLFVDGWIALTGDVMAKVHTRLLPTDTLLQFFNIYAPGADHNNPEGYAQFVCQFLAKALAKPVTLASTIKEIYLA